MNYIRFIAGADAVPEKAEPRCGRSGCLLGKGMCGDPGWSLEPGSLKSALLTLLHSCCW